MTSSCIMGTPIETLLSYTPPLVQRHYARAPNSEPTPTVERLSAAALQIEIDGLLGFAQRLTDYDNHGAWVLSQLLDEYLEPLLDLCCAEGGELSRCNGYQLLLLWPVGITGKEISNVARRAAACGLKLQTWAQQHDFLAPLQDILLDYDGDDAETLSALYDNLITQPPRIILRISLNVGELWAATVGGVENHWECLLAGPMLSQWRPLQDGTQESVVMLTPNAWQVLQRYAKAEMQPNTSACLFSLHRPLKPRPSPPIELSPQAANSLQRYLPPNVLAQLQQGLTTELSELRYVSVLMLNFIGLDNQPAHTRQWLPQAQEAVYELQNLVVQFGGSVVELSIDDNGTNLVVAWGVPLHDHNDNAVRAVWMALQVQQVLKDLALHGNIGISSGAVFCGHHGNAQYRRFDLLGACLHTAKQLQHIADDIVLCDAATYEQAQLYLNFEQLKPLAHISSSLNTLLYRPLQRSLRPTPTGRVAMVGRRTAREQLQARVLLLREQAQGGVVWINGGAGSGKTCLLDDFQQTVQTTPLRCLRSLVSVHHRYTPYAVWQDLLRQVFQQLLGETNHELLGLRILKRLQAYGQWRDHLPLLRILLPLPLLENDLTQAMQQQVRADNTESLCCIMLKDLLQRSRKRYVFIIDNAQWLDSASWRLLHRLSRQIKPLLIVVASRPLHNSPAFAQVVQQHPQTERIDIQSLSQDAINALLCQRFNVASMPISLSQFIYEQTQGDALFSIELAHVLRERNVLQIYDGQCQFAQQQKPLLATDYPNNTQNAMIRRIAKLSNQQQLTLKVASVIGQRFSLRSLQRIYPLNVQAEELPQWLDELRKLDIVPLPPEVGSKDSYYLFKHSLTQEVAYRLMPYRQRNQLHQALAEWYEERYADNISAHYPLLALHWEKADVPNKALLYLSKAGEQALQHAAYPEAVLFYSQALCMKETQHYPPTQRAQWALQLSQAYAKLERFMESREYLEAALQHLETAIPKNRASLLWRLLWQLLRQAGHRWRSGKVKQLLSNEQRERQLQAALAYEYLGLQASYEQRYYTALYAHLSALNLAQTASDDAPILARAYAHLGNNPTLLPLGLTSWAQLYRDRTHSLLAQHTLPLDSQTRIAMLQAGEAVRHGRWLEGQQRLDEAQRIAERLGDIRNQMECLNLRASVLAARGELAAGLQQSQLLYTLGRQEGDLQGQVWGLCGLGLFALRLGDVDTAVNCLKNVQALPSEKMQLREAVRICGLLALVFARQDLPPRAIPMAQKTARLIKKIKLPTLDLWESYASVAQVYLQQWESHVDGGKPLSFKERYAFSQLSRDACDVFLDYADVYPIAQPRAQLWDGLYWWLRGKAKKAIDKWQNAVDLAARMEMPYEQALAHYELARHLEDEQQAALHLQQAKVGFGEMGVGGVKEK